MEKFVKADKPDKGKKFEQVTKMVDLLRKSPDEPIPFDTLCSMAGAKYPQDIQAAMFSLELAGLIDRYTFVRDGSTRSHVAYQWAGGNNGRPTSGAKSASKKRSATSNGKSSQARQKKAAAKEEVVA